MISIDFDKQFKCNNILLKELLYKYDIYKNQLDNITSKLIELEKNINTINNNVLFKEYLLADPVIGDSRIVYRFNIQFWNKLIDSHPILNVLNCSNWITNESLKTFNIKNINGFIENIQDKFENSFFKLCYDCIDNIVCFDNRNIQLNYKQEISSKIQFNVHNNLITGWNWLNVLLNIIENNQLTNNDIFIGNKIANKFRNHSNSSLSPFNYYTNYFNIHIRCHDYAAMEFNPDKYNLIDRFNNYAKLYKQEQELKCI